MTMAESNSSGRANSGLRLWRRLWNTPWPSIGCEISQSGVSAARWSWNTGSLEAASGKPLPEGAIEASALRENIRNLEPVREALGAALESIGIARGPETRHPTDAILVIPDQAARLFLFTLDTFPPRPAEALSLVQWRLKKSVPFDIESAAISYRAQRRADQWEVMAVAAPQAVVRQYEALVEGFGLRPRSVVLSTLATLGLLRETGGLFAGSSLSQGRDSAGVLVGKFSPPWFTTAILQSGQLRLFRTVGIPAGTESLLSPEHVFEALYPSMTFFQDQFGGRIEKAYLCGLGESGPAVMDLLTREFSLAAAPLGGNGRLATARLDPSHQELYFSALLGVLEEQSRA
jgi:type IV pilus assembly protein PilM